MSELNKEQEIAANVGTGIYLILGIPGCGKTRVMTERIKNMILKQNVQPENILGITFTKNSSEELRSRLVPVLGDSINRIKVSTIHSFCYYLLKQEGVSFEILSGKEQLIFIKNIMKKLKLQDLSVGMILGEISLAKNNLISVDEFMDLYENDKTMIKVGNVYREYENDKSQKMLLDFDDLLVEVYSLLKDNEMVREKYRMIYTQILLDEAQDINPAQLSVLQLLIGDSANGDKSSFYAVGDDSQSIFSFAGASIHHILNFQKVFPGSVQYFLTINYRSTPQILNACANLIKHNKKQIHKELNTVNPDGDDISILENSSEETEAQSVVTEIQELISTGYDYKDIAVLYRANFQSMIIEEKFLEHRVPYHIENGLNFYDRYEVRVLLDYLRFIMDPLSDDGDESLTNILNVPNRYISKKFIKELETYSSKKGIHLYEGLKMKRIKLPYIRHNVKVFIELIDPLIKDAGNMSPSELIRVLRSSLDFDRLICDEDIPSPDDAKIQNLNQLQISASRYKTIRAFVDYTESFSDVEIIDNKAGCSLMTIHKSKGLEFPVVTIIGLVEGILPSKNGNLEEERRVAFVGISRAMKKLYVSYSHTYLGQPSKRSIFLDEMLGKV